TSSGKVQRSLCKKMYLEGSLDAVCMHILEDKEMKSEIHSVPAENTFIYRIIHELQDRESQKKILSLYLQEVCSKLLNTDTADIDLDKPVTGMGADSLTGLEIANEINKSLRVNVSVANILEGASINDISEDTLNNLENENNCGELKNKSITLYKNKNILSHGQRAMYFLHKLTGGGLAYHISKAVKIYGDLKIPELKKSFSILVQRHPMLRAVFEEHDGEPVQIIKENGEVDFLYEEFMNLEEDSVSKRLGSYAQKPFDLSVGPLFRVNVLKTGNDEYVLLFVIHHIISDFWSIVHMMKELESCYISLQMGNEPSLRQINHKYIDYVNLNFDMLNGLPVEKLKTYWMQKLKDTSFVLNLPIDFNRPPVQTYMGSTIYRQADSSMNNRIREFACKHNVTLYTILAAAYQVLLYRLTGQRDILIGTPVSGRNRTEFNDICGYFINPLVLRGFIEENQSFLGFLEEYKKTVAEALENQELPFNHLVEMLAPERDLSRPPVVQAFFTLLKSPAREYQNLTALSMPDKSSRLFGYDARSIEVENCQAQFELSLLASDTGHELDFSIEYNTGLFSKNTVERFLGYYFKILDEVIENPDFDIDRIEILPHMEKEKILYEWNESYSDYPRKKCVHEIVEEMVQKNPDKTAVFFKDESVSYRELDNLANEISNLLIRNDVKPGEGVAICMERSIEMVASLLGVFKAGAYYIPVDPHFPSDRIEYIIEDSKASTILLSNTPGSESTIFEKISNAQSKVLVLDEMRNFSSGNSLKPSIETSSEDLAYVIYTSGSTGKPKGVMLKHKGVVNFLFSMMKEPGIGQNDKMLAVTTLSFDISVLELFLPLCAGAELVIADRAIAVDGVNLIKCIVMNDITMMQATPSTYKIISDTGWNGNGKLKILCGGEALPPELAKSLLRMSTEVYNMYGPTETTVWSSVYRIRDANEPIYIGKPINNTVMYILDSNLNPLPIGTSGELYIGGDGVAQGYLNRPELTAERFIKNPFDDKNNSIIYKTGDLARYKECGDIELLGRIDNQIKVRGHRIEPGEIEATLVEHPGIREAVVIAVKFDDGDLRLVAYVAYNNSQEMSSREVREFLKNKLPEYMIPSFFITVDFIPLLPNGKINRNALPEIKENVSGVGNEHEKAENRIEASVAEMWKHVLGIETLGMNDNFFDVGGHSLLMSKIHSMLIEAGLCGKDISIVEMFQYPTVRSFCSHVVNRANNDLESSRTEERKDRESISTYQRDLRRTSRMKR
ncbi:MAG: hypothetical protein K0R50_2017, partial [Eubacterium sp.]|nr:hypothetical protein [Eubacterium sp.]